MLLLMCAAIKLLETLRYDDCTRNLLCHMQSTRFFYLKHPRRPVHLFTCIFFRARRLVQEEKRMGKQRTARSQTARRYNFLVTYVHYARPPLINFKAHSSSSAHTSNTARRRSLFVPAINLRAELIRKCRRHFLCRLGPCTR